MTDLDRLRALHATANIPPGTTLTMAQALAYKQDHHAFCRAMLEALPGLLRELEEKTASLERARSAWQSLEQRVEEQDRELEAAREVVEAARKVDIDDLSCRALKQDPEDCFSDGLVAIHEALARYDRAAAGGEG